MPGRTSHIASDPEAARLAALTLAQAAFVAMRESGAVSDAQLRSVLDNAVALLLEAPTGDSPAHRKAGAIVRELADDILG